METLIDTIVAGFLTAIDSALQRMVPIGVGALGLLALIAYVVRYWPYVMSTGAGLGDLLAGFLTLMIGLGITLWITQNITPMGDALYEAAVTLGLQASGASVSATQLRNPSFILLMHKDVTKPLEDFILNHTGWSMMWNAGTVWSFWGAEMIIYVVFVGIALHVAMIVIEFYLALVAAALLVPCMVFAPGASLGEFAVGWVLGGTVRVFMVTVIVGIAVPLFSTLSGVGGGTDPRWIEVLGLLGGAALFGAIAWAVPGRAANLVGHGLSLTGSTVAGAMASSTRVLLMAQQASRVVSPMLRRT